MNFIVFILQIFIIYGTVYASENDNTTTSNSSAACKNSKDHLPVHKLKDHLTCSYDSLLRPVVNHRNKTRVSMKMILKFFTYDEESTSLNVDAWLPMHWKDEHLSWKPDEFDHITKIHFSSYEIWTPDLSLYNRADESGSTDLLNGITCIVNFNGLIMCVPPTRLTAVCKPNLKNFPFDSQNCTIIIGSWVHTGEELDVNLDRISIEEEELISDGNWKLVKSFAYKEPGKYKCCPNATYPSLRFSLLIKRTNSHHSATVIIPAMVMLLLTITALWISPERKDRINLCFVNIILQVLHLQYITYLIPVHGDESPNLLIYAKDSLLLGTFALILTIILRNLVQGNWNAPFVITSAASFVVKSRIGQIILLSSDSSLGKVTEDGTAIINDHNNKSDSSDWLIFAKFIDRTCFIIYLIVYISMFSAFNPQ